MKKSDEVTTIIVPRQSHWYPLCTCDACGVARSPLQYAYNHMQWLCCSLACAEQASVRTCVGEPVNNVRRGYYKDPEDG